MKSLITSVFLLALLLPVGAAAYDFEVDGIYYNINGNEATVTSVIDDFWNHPAADAGYSGDVTIPETVTYNGVTYMVTAIGESAFMECADLTSVDIPNSITIIGNGAFWGCSSLASITIPNSVTTIDVQAFAYCNSLASLTIPKSVSFIGERAFDGCTGFQNITVDSDNLWYDSRDNCNALIETETNTLIAGCENTIIPNTVTIIGDNAFDGMLGLTHITIPNSVISIGNNAFHTCRNLMEITIPSSVTSIAGCAFAYCSSLTSLTIPSSVTSFGYAPFVGCSGLTSITVESGNPNFDSREDCNAIINKATKTLIAGCRNTTIPNSVIAIGSDAFANCTGLTSVTIPASVTFIEMSAFLDCNNLMDVYSHITNPSSVLVGYHAFYSYDNNYARTLHVPHGTLDAYQADVNWYPYFERIVEMEPETGLKGDVNHDGEVNIADVNVAIDIILGGNGDILAADVNGDSEISIADINVLIEIILGGDSPSQDDHGYVDLGLPSGTLWATCNVGANSPEDFGHYFAWGETELKGDFTWETYKWCNGSSWTMTKYCTKNIYGTIDNKTELEPEDDAASVNWGPSWRMPTKDQVNELMSNCSYELMTMNGVNGMLVTGPNGNSIFLPATGCFEGSTRQDVGLYGHYWSRTLDPDSNHFAFTLLTIADAPGVYSGLRNYGFSVRAVRASRN